MILVTSDNVFTFHRQTTMGCKAIE